MPQRTTRPVTRLLNSALIPAFVSCTIPARELGGFWVFRPGPGCLWVPRNPNNNLELALASNLAFQALEQLSQAFWGWLLRTLEIEGTDVGLST